MDRFYGIAESLNNRATGIKDDIFTHNPGFAEHTPVPLITIAARIKDLIALYSQLKTDLVTRYEADQK